MPLWRFVKRVLRFIRKHWVEWIVPMVGLLWEAILKLLRAIGEDRVVGGLNKLINSHSAGFSSHFKVILFLVLTHPLWVFALVASGLLFRAFVVVHRGDINLVVEGIVSGNVALEQGGQRYRRAQELNIERGAGFFCRTLLLCNKVTLEDEPKNAGKLRAQVSFRVREVESPAKAGVWLDEPTNIASFAPGESHELILMLGNKYTEEWWVVSNGRSRQEDQPSYNKMLDLWPGSKGEIYVHLVDEAGKRVKTFLLRFQWKRQDAPEIFWVKQ